MSDERSTGFLILFICCIVALMFVLSAFFGRANAQEHRHPPQDVEIHKKFYQTWNMPDNRRVSCCHDEDCFPAQAKQVNGTWFARKDDSEDWIEIPRNKVDIGLLDSPDPPDTRAHLCGRKYTFQGASAFTVFCFISGAGG